jgi:hypothetical protein
VLALLAPGIVLALEANEIFKRADPGVVVIVAEGAKRTDDRLVSGVLVEPLEIVTVCRGVVDAVKLTVKQGSVQRSAKLRFQEPHATSASASSAWTMHFRAPSR